MGLKESEIVGKNEEYPEHYEVLSGLSLLISRSGKNRKTEVITRENKYKKRPYVTRMCVLHKVIFLILSWFFSGYQLLPFWGYVGLPWNIRVIPTLLQGFYQPYFMAFFRIFHITIITEYPLKKESINFCSTILVRT